MKDFNVLITGCSSFSKEIVDCIKNNPDGANVSVVGVDCNYGNLLKTGVDYFHVVPRITDPTYIDVLIDICKMHDVDVILPYITIELGLLSRNIKKFEDAGIKLSVMDPEVLAIANDKLELHKRFPQYMPTCVLASEVVSIEGFAKRIGYPQNRICCKLTNRSGGQGFAIVDDVLANDLNHIGRSDEKKYITLQHLTTLVNSYDGQVMLQECIEGQDYSVCLLAEHGRVRYMAGYVGYTMVGGAVMRGEIKKVDAAYDIAENVVADLCLDGNICLDFIVNEDGAKLLEINPRLNATIAFVAHAGANLPYYRCKQLLGGKLPESLEINYGLKMNKYYESEYFV